MRAELTVVGLDGLAAMKRLANRGQDVADLLALGLGEEQAP